MYSDRTTEEQFEINTYIQSGTDVQIICKTGYRLVDANKTPVILSDFESYSTCRKGSWSRDLHCEPGTLHCNKVGSFVFLFTRMHLDFHNIAYLQHIMYEMSDTSRLHLQSNWSHLQFSSAK